MSNGALTRLVRRGPRSGSGCVRLLISLRLGIRTRAYPLLGGLGSGVGHGVSTDTLSTAAHCRLRAHLRNVPGRGGIYRNSFGPSGVVVAGSNAPFVLS